MDSLVNFEVYELVDMMCTEVHFASEFGEPVHVYIPTKQISLPLGELEQPKEAIKDISIVKEVAPRKEVSKLPYKKCQFCKRNVYSSNMARHIRRIHAHTNSEGCVCPICGRPGISAKNLEQHIKSHYGPRIMRCAFCNMQFHNYSELILHNNSEHSITEETVVGSYDP